MLPSWGRGRLPDRPTSRDDRRQRTPLLTRLEQLKKQHGWGDLGDAEYQRERDAVRAALRDLPDDDRVTAFDAYRTRILALPP